MGQKQSTKSRTTLMPFSGIRYSENSQRVDYEAGEEACVLCGAPLARARQTHWVRVVDGGRFGRRSDPDDGPGEMGCFPVGSRCRWRLVRAGVEVWEEDRC